MDSERRFNRSVIFMVTLAYLTLALAVSQDCQLYPQECDAKKVLSDFPFLNDLITSDAGTDVYCDVYERISLSEDGTTSEYYLVYKKPGATTKFTDMCTYKVANNKQIYMSCRNYSSFVYLFTLDYMHEDHCFVGHANLTENSNEQTYYMLGNADSDISEYYACAEKIYAYTRGNLTFTRLPQMCENFPLKPQ